MKSNLVKKGEYVAKLYREGKIKHPAILELLKEINSTLNNYDKLIETIEIENLQKDLYINESIIRPTKINIEKISLQKLQSFATFFITAYQSKLKLEINNYNRKQPIIIPKL